jgi:hypothetical protein
MTLSLMKRTWIGDYMKQRTCDICGKPTDQEYFKVCRSSYEETKGRRTLVHVGDLCQNCWINVKSKDEITPSQNKSY